MSIPAYHAFMLPLLEVIADGGEHQMPEIVTALCDRFKLQAAEREQLLPSGQQTIAANRIGWAKTYLKKAGLLTNPVRGKVRITDEGSKVLKQKPAAIDAHFLQKYPAFKSFIAPVDQPNATAESKSQQATPSKDPQEAMEDAHREIQIALADELLERIRASSPAFFERLVVKLLVAMGYGGSLADAGKAVGKSGDGGIDGTIKEDRLGLDVVCIQAKRWKGEYSVGRPEVQAFVGSMEGAKARKGVFICTSTFTKEAEEHVVHLDRKVVLIDGLTLARLMIEHGVAVTTVGTLLIQQLDSDFFEAGEE